MSTTENKTTVLRLMDEYFNNGNEQTCDELADPDVVIHGVTADIRGAGAAKPFYAQLRKAFDPWHLAVEELIAEGDQVVVRLIESGTMSGPVMGQPPNGKQFVLETVQICRIHQGKLVEMWGFRDSGAIMRQLELVPGPAAIHT